MFKAGRFDHLYKLGWLSKEAIDAHLKLYKGYVDNTNKIQELLGSALDSERDNIAISELKRRYSWEYNGMILHELYFDNLTKDGVVINEEGLGSTIIEQYGTFDGWKKDFLATGEMRGIGWVALVRDTEGRLSNIWINEHNEGLLVDTSVLLVMDVFEHAYFKDFGTDKDKYIKNFFKSINWDEVEMRFTKER